MSKPSLAAVVGLLAIAGSLRAQSPAGTPAQVPCGPACSPASVAYQSYPMAVAGDDEGGYFTFDLDYLLWWVKNEGLDSSAFSSDLQLGPGFIASAKRDVRRDPVAGVRARVGYWMEDFDPILSPGRRLPLVGVEGIGFMLSERTLKFLSGPAPALVRPFFNVNDATTNGFVVAFPGLATGQLSGQADYQLHGAEINLWCNVASNPPGQLFRADVMAGARYLNLDGALSISQDTLFANDLAAFPPFLPYAGSRLQAFDYLGVENQFYGGQVGARLSILLSHAEFQGTFKYAVGTTHQRLNVHGGQVLTAPDGTQTTFEGGLLALASNSGEHTRNRLSHVPEASFTAVVHLTRCLSLHVGYSILYFSNVIRPGGQVDRVIDVTQIPNFPGAAGATPTGLGRPAVLFNETGLVVQGVNVGFQFAW